MRAAIARLFRISGLLHRGVAGRERLPEGSRVGVAGDRVGDLHRLGHLARPLGHGGLGRAVVPAGIAVIVCRDPLADLHDREHAAHLDRAVLAPAVHHRRRVVGDRHFHLAHVGHAGGAHRHVLGLKPADLLRHFCLVGADEGGDLVAHGIHRVVRLVAMDRPVAQMLRLEVEGAHRPHGDVDGDLGPGRLGWDPAAIGARYLEVVAVHVDRVVGHRQVADAHPHVVAPADHQRVDARKDTAVPGPQVEVRHLHDPRDIGARVDVEGVQHDEEVAVDAAEGRILGVHDEHAHHAHGHLGHLVGVRMVHEGARLDEVELVGVGLAGRDGGAAQPVHAVHSRGNDEPVPMHCRGLGQPVGHEDADPVAFHGLDRRAGRGAVVAPEMGDRPLGQLALDGLGDEMELLDAVLHAPGQRPAVQRDDGVVIRARAGRRGGLGARGARQRGLRQGPVRGLRPGLGGHHRGACGTGHTGSEQLTSIHHRSVPSLR